jgi:hypothetical protein
MLPLILTVPHPEIKVKTNVNGGGQECPPYN